MKIKFELSGRLTLIEKLGFGTWGLGGSAYGTITEKTAKELVVTAYQRGIRTFDTSPLYGNGRSEKILGSALKEYERGSYKVVSKYGLYDSGDSEYRDFTELKFNSSLMTTLQNLETDYVDFFLAHSPLESDYETFASVSESMHREMQIGRIHSMGVSVKKPSDIGIAKNFGLFSSYEFNFSLMDQRARSSITGDSNPLLTKFARTPFNFGFLTESPPPRKPPTGKNFHLRGWSSGQFEMWHKAREFWLQIAEENELKLQELALLFCLSSPYVDVVFPGFMNLHHLGEALECLEHGIISPESMQMLETLYDQWSPNLQVELKEKL